MPSTLQPVLERQPFFQGMTPDAMALLTGCVKNVRFDTGEYLVREGTDANSFFLIRTGRVALSASNPPRSLVVHTAGPGDMVGWSWIVAPYRYRFDARATEPTVAFELDGACLRNKCDANPALGYQLLKRVSGVLGQRVDDLQMRLLDVYRGSHGA